MPFPRLRSGLHGRRRKGPGDTSSSGLWRCTGARVRCLSAGPGACRETACQRRADGPESPHGLLAESRDHGLARRRGEPCSIELHLAVEQGHGPGLHVQVGRDVVRGSARARSGPAICLFRACGRRQARVGMDPRHPSPTDRLVARPRRPPFLTSRSKRSYCMCHGKAQRVRSGCRRRSSDGGVLAEGVCPNHSSGPR